MDNKPLVSKVFSLLNEFLKLQGFSELSKEGVTLRNRNLITEKLFFDVIDRNDSVLITVDFNIRHEAIQNVRETIDPRLKRRVTYTVHLKLSGLCAEYNREDLDFSKNPDINQINNSNYLTFLEAFKMVMEDIGFNFFDRFQTIGDFDDWFNKSVLDGTYDFEKGSSTSNALGGIISANLSKNPKFEEIYNLWMTGISEKALRTRNEIEAARKYLDEKTT